MSQIYNPGTGFRSGSNFGFKKYLALLFILMMTACASPGHYSRIVEGNWKNSALDRITRFSAGKNDDEESKGLQSYLSRTRGSSSQAMIDLFKEADSPCWKEGIRYTCRMDRDLIMYGGVIGRESKFRPIYSLTVTWIDRVEKIDPNVVFKSKVINLSN
jgi:hypothetical protein